MRTPPFQRFLVGCSLSLVAPVALALSTTYTGTDGVWTNAASWSAGIPAAGDTASITNERLMNSFDGYSVGTILASGKKFYLRDRGTLTMDNLGATAAISVGPSDFGYTGFSPVVSFTDDLNITVSANRSLNLYGTIRGEGKLALIGAATSGLTLRSAGIIEAGKLDCSAFGYVYLMAGSDLLDGLTIVAGSTCYFTATSYAAIAGCNLEMSGAYALFRSNTGETISIGSWKVGDTDLPKGTYNAASGVVEGVDMAVVFALSNISVTVTEAPPVATIVIVR